LLLTTKGKREVLWPNPTIIPTSVSLYMHIFRASAPPLQATQSSYKVPSDPEPKTSCKDTAEWSEHIQWTKQSLVGPVHRRPSKLDANIHTWAGTVDVEELASNAESYIEKPQAGCRLLWLSLSLSFILRPTVSRPVSLGIKHPSAAYDQIFFSIRQLRVCWCGTLSLTRGRVCSFQLLLALASAVVFGSESRGTRDHILLPQIRDFPFRRILRLAGLWWKYSNPLLHGICYGLSSWPPHIASAWTA
jgi:hypothetical protein